MNGLMQTAQRLQTFLQENNQKFCFMGGLAVQYWGEPRVTRDVDATIFVGFGEETEAIELLLEHYPARLDNASDFALQNRILLLNDNKTHTEIDLSLGALDFEGDAIKRAKFCELETGIKILICSAEDLITFKAFANRDIDWHDIKGILIRQQGKLDFDLIRGELAPLAELKEEPEIVARLEKLIKQYA